MNDKLVTVARFTNYMEAELAKQLLEDEGIMAFAMGQNVATNTGGVPAAIDIQLQTPESQAEEAREILEADRQQKDQESQSKPDEDWDLDDDLGPQEDEELDQDLDEDIGQE
jgi:hypothetical protein